MTAQDRKDDKILEALLLYPKVREASKACGICPSAIYKRLKDPGFSSRYESMKRDALKENNALIQSYLERSIKEMAAIFDDPLATPQVRLNAADAILRNALKFNEQIEIIERLTSIEKSMNQEWKEDF